MNTCDVRDCDFTAAWLVEPGVHVCERHGCTPQRRAVCKFCGCQIASTTDVTGDHSPTCPRTPTDHDDRARPEETK